MFGLDPGTVAAARAAGVDEASLLDGEALGQVEQLAAEGSHMEAAVVQLTKIVSNLSQPSKKPQSDLDSILDVGGASGSNEAQSLGSGRKNAAALRQLTKIYIENPKVIYEALVKQMELDFQVAAPTWSAKGCRVFYRPGMVVDEVAASSVPDPDPVVVVRRRNLGRSSTRQPNIKISAGMLPHRPTKIRCQPSTMSGGRISSSECCGSGMLSAT